MDSKSIIYFIGYVFVGSSTFFFVMYVLPLLPPLVGLFVLTVMLVVMSFGYGVRIRRLRMASREKQSQAQNETSMATQEYIEQAKKLMGKK